MRNGGSRKDSRVMAAAVVMDDPVVIREWMQGSLDFPTTLPAKPKQPAAKAAVTKPTKGVPAKPVKAAAKPVKAAAKPKQAAAKPKPKPIARKPKRAKR
jgi:hypothetical protein